MSMGKVGGYRMVKRTRPENSGTIGRFEVEEVGKLPYVEFGDRQNMFVPVNDGEDTVYVRFCDRDDYTTFLYWQAGRLDKVYRSPYRDKAQNEKAMLDAVWNDRADERCVELELQAHEARKEYRKAQAATSERKSRVEELTAKADDDERTKLEEMFGGDDA